MSSGGFNIMKSTKRKSTESKPLSIRFVLESIIIYSILLIVVGGIFVVPLFKRIVGGDIEQEFIFIIYWGLILLVGYIGLCTCLLSEHISSQVSETTDADNKTKME